MLIGVPREFAWDFHRSGATDHDAARWRWLLRSRSAHRRENATKALRIESTREGI